MYPYPLFLGLDLYSILITVGVVAGMLLIRLQGDMRALNAKLQNSLLMLTPLAVLSGFVAAVLMQALYNIAAEGGFHVHASTGSTFYGGLLGGMIGGISIYFIGGHFIFRDGYHKKRFRDTMDIIPAVITVAHGFGRLGCLMAGCCHGKVTDAWYGIVMVNSGDRVVPVQLFEAIFLFALTAALLLMMKKGVRYQLPTYLMAYGVWRFFIEYARADERGQTVVSFLSPSQLFSVVMITVGIALLAWEIHLDRKAARHAQHGGAEKSGEKKSPEESEVSADA